MTVYDPGIEFYAEEILSGVPFSFPRYGEGEWHGILPTMHPKRHPQYSEWKEKEAREMLRSTVLNCHDHERYWPAVWHQEHPPVRNKLRDWMLQTGSDEINWHWGGVWRAGAEQRTLFKVIDAIRQQELPFIVVGPESVRCVESEISVARFIEIHPTHAYYDRDKIVQEILDIEEPALISFSAGGTADILIHRLFPEIGEMSYMIDFGAMWNGLCGTYKRAFQKRIGDKIENQWKKKWTYPKPKKSPAGCDRQNSPGSPIEPPSAT